MQNLLDLLKGNLSVYDIETIKNGRSEMPYSAAVYSDGKVNEKFFQLPEDVLKNSGYRSKKYLKRSGYDSAVKSVNWMDENSRSNTLFSLFENDLVNKPGTLVGHNIPFDINNTFSSLNKEHQNRMMKAFGVDDINHIASLQPKNVKSLIMAGHGKSAFDSYKSYLLKHKLSGTSSVVDTGTLTSILLASAQERGDLGVDFKGDYQSGVKLGFISKYFDWGEGHTGVDTENTHKLLTWLDKALQQTLDKSAMPDNEVRGFLGYIQNIQDSGWRRIGNEKKVAETALDFINNGEVERQIKGRWVKRNDLNAGNIHEFFGGDKYSSLTSEETSNLWNKEISNLTSLKAKYPKSWNARAQINNYNRFYGDEEEFIDSLGLSIKTPKRVLPNNLLIHSDSIKSDRSLLKYGAAALGLWAVYNIFSGSRIEGRHDKYNTIEGMKHGGVAEDNRHELTDFGSPMSQFFKSVAHDFITTLKEHPTAAILGAVPGFYKGYKKSKEEGRIRWGAAARNMALDFADDFLMFGAGAAVNKFPKLGKYQAIGNMQKFFEHPWTQTASIGFFGYSAGKLTGEIFGKLFGEKIPGKDDAYNTIEGLFHGGVASDNRHQTTDFGSGWNALRGLARAGETFEEMISSSAFQKALSNAERVEKIGEGKFGRVFKMKSMFRDTEFDFARKIGKIGEYEPDALKQFGDSFAPSYYNHVNLTTDKVKYSHLDMEYFDGRTFADMPSQSKGNDVFSGQRMEWARDVRYQIELMGWKHNDLHFGNLMRVNTPDGLERTGVVDWGMARRIPSSLDDFKKQLLNPKYNFNPISGKDDTYNTIEGLFHGGIAESSRHSSTDFGSGYQGPVAPVHHPEIEPEYNTAQDIPAYQMMRASAIGLSDSDIYKKMSQPQGDMSDYVSASATAGTALHQLLQAQYLQSGQIDRAEIFTFNQEHQIGGHIDMMGPMGVGDIKTVNNGIYQEILKSGPKPAAKSQVMFYMGNEGIDQGYVEYVNRNRPSQRKRYFFQFNPYQYEQLLRKTERVRSRVESEIASGDLMKSGLPKTASLARLKADMANHPSNEETISQIPEYQEIFNEEMAYLRTTKRGMPTGGEGRKRIDERNRRYQQTQGIGLQMFNQRQGHHIM